MKKNNIDISEVEQFRILVLKKHLDIEFLFNNFISQYIFRCCKGTNSTPIDACNIFQDMILDNLGFNKKREIIFDLVLCNTQYRNTFSNIASFPQTEQEHMKLSKNIDEKIRKLNKIRNIIAHEIFLMDENSIIDSYKAIESDNKNIGVISKLIQKNKRFINLKAETINIEMWHKDIKQFFKEIHFK